MPSNITNSLFRPLLGLLPLLVIGLASITPTFITAQSGTTVSVLPTTGQIEVGQVTTVEIQIEIENGRAYGSGSYELAFDNSVLTVTDFDLNPDRLLGAVNLETVDNTTVIKFNGVANLGPFDDPITGLFLLATATFEGNANGVSDLTLSFRADDAPKDSGANDLNAAIVSSQLQVGSTPTNTPTATLTSTPTPTLPATGTADATSTPVPMETDTPTSTIPSVTDTPTPTATDTTEATSTVTHTPSGTMPPATVATTLPSATPSMTPTTPTTPTVQSTISSTPISSPIFTETPTTTTTSTPNQTPDPQTCAGEPDLEGCADPLYLPIIKN